MGVAHVGKLVLASDRPATKPPAYAAELLISQGIRASPPRATPRDRTGQHQFPHMSHLGFSSTLANMKPRM